MSQMEYKTVLRVEIPELRKANKTKALEYFIERIGYPSEVDKDDETVNPETGEMYEPVNYFDYEGRLQPVYDSNRMFWGVDYITAHRTENKIKLTNKYDFGISIQEFQNLAKKISDRFDVDINEIRLLNYDWYNGVDEPIHL